jgi:hypothetical protein
LSEIAPESVRERATALAEKVAAVLSVGEQRA